MQGSWEMVGLLMLSASASDSALEKAQSELAFCAVRN